MRKTGPLQQFLPIQFGNGVSIKQFAKPCLRCGASLTARDMHGIARLVDSHVALAAKARCPKCGLSFGVACVIDSDKKVRRVILPPLLFRWYLQVLPDAPTASDPSASAARRDYAEDQRAAEQTAEPAPTLAEGEFQRSMETVGQYQGQPIPAWIIARGDRLLFDRVEARPQGRVQGDEIVIDGYLVYRR